ncbi:MAG: ScpA family protein [Candidatus Paceibacterota bacterium]
MYEVKIKNFSGPLDLLLKLVEEKNLEITELSLKEVTEDFLNYLNQQEIIPVEELVDFLVVASTLILIKSKAILPFLKLSEEEEKEIIDLENQLKLYKIFKEASKKIEALLKRKQILFSGFPHGLENNEYFFPPKNFSLEKLKEIFQKLSSQLEREPLPEKKMQRIVSLKNKIEELVKILSNKEQCQLKDLVKEKKDKLDIILTFLALLHLVKEKFLVLKQNKNFGEIWILK